MTQCDKIQAIFSLWALGDLSEAEAREIEDHLQGCSACAREAQAYRDVLEGLSSHRLPNPGELYFRRQAITIEQQVQDSESETEADLSAELKGLGVPDPGAAFFASQREAILNQIQSEAVLPEAELEPLSQEIKSLPVEDPGDLFFHRQFKTISRQIRSEAQESSREGFWSTWARPLAVAAAVFFLVLGVARISNWNDEVVPADWSVALEYLADEEEVSLDEIDDMDGEQLERLASNLEGSIYIEAEDNLIEEPVELDDLNEQELDHLIQRLELRAKT